MRSPFELFHRIADPGSAKIRSYIVENDLESFVQFRNVIYPEVVADLKKREGTDAPALWDGEHLFSGFDAIVARLKAFNDVGRNG